MFDDYFDDDTISGGWTQSFVSPGSGVEYTLVVSGTISGAADRHYLRLYSGYAYTSGVTFSGSGVYQSTADNFDIETKIAEPTYLFSDGINNYQTGLAVMVDSSNYIYLFRSPYYLNYGYKWSISGSSAGQSLAAVDYLLPPYFIRLTKSGNNYTMWYSERESEEWIPAPSLTLNTGTCNVWLFCNQSTTSGTQIWADFEYFITVS
jgi:hypothetical protein